MLKSSSMILGFLLLLLPMTWAGESAAGPNGLQVAYDVRFDADERGEFLNVLGTIRNDKADLSFPLEVRVTLQREVDGELLTVSARPAKTTLGESGSTFSKGSVTSFDTYFDLYEIDLDDMPRLAEDDEATKQQLAQELVARISLAEPR